MAVVAMAAAVIGMGSGCGPQNGSASAGNNGAPDDMAVKYTQCMRENGVQVADPKPGQPIQIQGGPQDAAKIQAAQEKCKQYAPQQEGGAQSGEDLDRQAKLVACLRDHGVTVADPQPGQPVRIEGKKENEQDTQKAMADCQREVGVPSPAKAG